MIGDVVFGNFEDFEVLFDEELHKGVACVARVLVVSVECGELGVLFDETSGCKEHYQQRSTVEVVTTKKTLTSEVESAANDFSVFFLGMNDVEKNCDLPVVVFIQRFAMSRWNLSVEVRMFEGKYTLFEVVAGVNQDFVKGEVHDNLLLAQGPDTGSTELDVVMGIPLAMDPSAAELSKGSLVSVLDRVFTSTSQHGSLEPSRGEVIVDLLKGDAVDLVDTGS